VSGYEIASLTGLESVPGPGSLRWTPVRKPLGITAFGINAYTAAEAGQDVVEEHTEERLGHEEVYLVVAGRATFVLDGEEHDVPSGSLVYLRDPKVKRHARAEEPGTTVLAIGGKPGQHEVSAWEYFFMAYPKADAGDLEGALAELDAGLSAKPDHPALHYHRACILSRAGRLDEAREALDRALSLDPKLAEWAEDDEDLAPLRAADPTNG
jgi:tetratricopeptide (TPR) repeat protein